MSQTSIPLLFLSVACIASSAMSNITCGETVRNSFASNKRYDFTVTASKTFKFEICQINDMNNGILKFYQSDGTTMYDYCDDGESYGIMTLCESGTGCKLGDEKAILNLATGSYYVQVEDLTKENEGEYELTLTCSSTNKSESEWNTIIIVSTTATIATVIVIVLFVIWYKCKQKTQNATIDEDNIKAVDINATNNSDHDGYRTRVVSASTVDLGIIDVVPPPKTHIQLDIKQPKKKRISIVITSIDEEEEEKNERITT